MAVKKTTSKTFIIDARMMVSTNCQVTADSLEDAIAKARDLSVTDFVNILGDHNDSELTITGLFQM